MCGLIGYTGKRPILPILLGGLKRLEYRGYDSAGLSVIQSGRLKTVKRVGKVAQLKRAITGEFGDSVYSGTGIGHTRWATHGEATEVNAHPHLSGDGKFALVHNGIIENYRELGEFLAKQGIYPVSQTDSEMLVLLIGYFYEGNFKGAVSRALKQVKGTYGVAVVCTDHPDRLVAARCGSPLIIGVGEDECFAASDIQALLNWTRQVIYLEDGELAEVHHGEVVITTLGDEVVERVPDEVPLEICDADKGAFAHFMLKEIFQQPQAVTDTMRGRLNVDLSSAILSGLNLSAREVTQVSRVLLTGCGTSLNAALLGRYYFEDLADLPTQVEQAAEFRYRNPIVEPGSFVVAISQSGETADTLAAVREATNKGAVVTGLCNVIGSTIARETGRGIYLHAGPEVSVASTKAFSCQCVALLMMALKFGRSRRLSQAAGAAVIRGLEQLPRLMEETLALNDQLAEIAEVLSHSRHHFYIGRGYLFPAALEGALKMKEISYIHAEGYHAAELKHGPIALLDEMTPVIALANRLPGYDKIEGNIRECRARKAPVVALITAGDERLADCADYIVEIPEAPIYLTPLLDVVALQLLAYHVAKYLGVDIDQPRNLAKSVTVE